MRPIQLHPLSFFAGGALALLGFVTLANRPAAEDAKWEFKVVEDPGEKDVEELGEDGWDYAGYLGEGIRGAGSDETLWKRRAE